MDTVAEIKNRADVVDFIGRYSKLSRSGKALKGLCPFHSEKHGSFFVYPDQQSWHCFGACSTGGDIFTFIMKKEGLTFPEAVERLAEMYGVPLEKHLERTEEQGHRERLFRVNSVAANYFHELLLNAPAAAQTRNYLETRNVSSDSIAEFQLGFALPEWQSLREYLNSQGYDDEAGLELGLLGKSENGRVYDRFRDKLMIPIFDQKGRVTGFGARVMDNSMPKYINSPDSPIFYKSSVLFGINTAASAIRQVDQAIMVEGYFDVIASHQAGFRNTIASMGTSITESHVNILRKLTRNVILALDADEAGAEAMSRSIAHETLLGNELKVAVAPAGKDPDDIINQRRDDWQTVIDEAIPLMEFIIERSGRSHNLKTAASKSKFIEEVLPFVAGIGDPVRKGHYLTELSRLVSIDTAELQYMVNRLKTARTTDKPITDEKVSLSGSLNIEDYLMSIYMKHPELRDSCDKLKAEYFFNTENREIFDRIRNNPDDGIDKTDVAGIHKRHHEYLLSIPEPKALLRERLAECALRIEERYLKSIAGNIKSILEDLATDAAEESSEYQQRLISINERLAEIFRLKNELQRRSRR